MDKSLRRSFLHKPLLPRLYTCNLYNYPLVPLCSEDGVKKEEEKMSSVLQTKKTSVYKQFGPHWSDIQTTEKPFFKIDIDKKFYSKIYGIKEI